MSWGLTVATELDFRAEEWKTLTARERIGRCLAYAEHAKLIGENASAEIREAYLDMSRHWLTLAHEIETTRFDSTATAPPPN
jgi:hypothetical protein